MLGAEIYEIATGWSHGFAFMIESFFFFKQKTAYEMLLCDWSSDVCSSDLLAGENGGDPFRVGGRNNATRSEERRVGKSVQQRVDLGGRRIIKKKKTNKQKNIKQKIKNGKLVFNKKKE